jgi:predicted aconitase with swiveling domain
MVQGAIYAGIAITEGWDPDPVGIVKTGDRVRVDPARGVVELLGRT